MKIKINKDDISYPSGNSVDPFGRVFFMKGRVFRAVENEFVSLCCDFFDSGLINELEEKKMIPKTIISDYYLDGYGLILEHEKVISTNPCEWSFSMLRDAALLMLKLNKVCIKHGFELKDGHPWNISFKKNNPIFLDIGSIIRKKENVVNGWFFLEFIDTFLIPIILMYSGEDYLCNAILSSKATICKRTLPYKNISDSNIVLGFLDDFFINCEKNNFPFMRNLPSLIKDEHRDLKQFLNNFHDIQRLELLVDSLSCINFTETMWSDYQSDFYREIDNNVLNKRFDRFDKIIKLLEKYSFDANSILDLAGNMGGVLYNIEKRTQLSQRLINIDYDEHAIEISYNRLKKANSRIETYLLNFMFPLREDVSRDLKSDVVLVLALTHHLILTQNYNLDLIFLKIKDFSNKYVYIEFMPLGLWGGGDLPAIPSWYNMEWFKNEFVKHFHILHEEKLEKNRIIFVGEVI